PPRRCWTLRAILGPGRSSARSRRDGRETSAMSGYTVDFTSVWSRRDMLLSGLLVTAELWVVALALGLAGGLLIGLGRLSRRKVLAWPSSCVIETFRGTPPLVQLFWFSYCLPTIFDIR